LKKVEQFARVPRLLYKEGEHADGTTESAFGTDARRTHHAGIAGPPIADAAARGAACPVDLVILLCGDGLASTVVARKLHVRDQTVSKWRARFLHDRLDGLYDEPRPGAPRTIDDAAVERW
jgi:hypothetical protein